MIERICALALMFFVYALLGWCCEVAYAAVRQGHFINRGFLNGPVCPIYGFGVLGAAFLLAPVCDNLPLLFLGSLALTTAMEFLTGLVLEKLFHARWWNYSERRFNVMGYVCLLFSLVWGAACTAVLRLLHPIVEAFAAWLPFTLCAVIDGVLLLVMLLDVVTTVISVHKISKRLMRLTLLSDELHTLSEELGRTIAGGTLTAKGYVDRGSETIAGKKEQLQQQLESAETQLAAWIGQQKAQTGERIDGLKVRLENMRQRISGALHGQVFGERRLLRAFPSLRSERYQGALESLRAFYKRHMKTPED